LWPFGIFLWIFGLFFPFWYVAPRKIWQPWLRRRLPAAYQIKPSKKILAAETIGSKKKKNPSAGRSRGFAWAAAASGVGLTFH
jgi:hypothetical protein